MLKLIGTLGLSFLLAQIATAASESEPERFSQNRSADQIAVLRAIDNICADTWCEGNFNFSFSKIVFLPEENATIVEFSLFPWDQEKVAEKHNCFIAGYASAARILDEGELAWPFYEKMGRCIHEAEESFAASSVEAAAGPTASVSRQLLH